MSKRNVREQGHRFSIYPQYSNKFIWLCISAGCVGADTQVADPSGTCSRSIKAEDL
jgi:hypothetical protein